MTLLALDPSGEFTEGKGTTGYSLWKFELYPKLTTKLLKVGELSASNYNSKETYWQAHLDLINSLKPNNIVIEDYLLYANKAMQQIGSRMETSKLIGIIEYNCKLTQTPIKFQRAVDVKSRWNDDILKAKGYLVIRNNRSYINGIMISRHIKDSIRHALHFIYSTYKKERKQNEHR